MFWHSWFEWGAVLFFFVEVWRNKFVDLFQQVTEKEKLWPWWKLQVTFFKTVLSSCQTFLFYLFNITPSPPRLQYVERFNYCSCSKNYSSWLIQSLQACGTYLPFPENLCWEYFEGATPYRSCRSWRWHFIKYVTNLEGAKSLARLLFIDLSSAFNCIEPHILAQM